MGDFNVAPTDLDIGIGDKMQKDGYAMEKQHFFQKKLKCGIKLKT